MTDAASIRSLNDRFRQGDKSIQGEWYLTQGISQLVDDKPERMANLLQKVAAFDEFDNGNDPYAEHDFGTITFQEKICFWKIDVFDHAMKYAAPDPADPKHSKRVLTIMRSEEY